MQLDEKFFDKMVNCFIECMMHEFGSEISLIEKECRYTQMGYFRLLFSHQPTHYKIIIENELRTFSIQIIDGENASTFLNRISSYNKQLGEENIENAITILKEVLDKNNFDLYYQKNEKIYKKSHDGKVIRINDMRELLNG